MRTSSGRSSKALAAAVTALLTITGGTTALADQFVADGDLLTSGPNVSITACPVAHAFTGQATVSFQGGGSTPHFASGAVVTVTAAPSAAAAAAGIIAAGGTLTLPAPWNNASSSASTSISLAVPAGIATGTYKMGMSASGNRNGGGVLTISDIYNVNVNCPANTPPTVSVPGSVSVEATTGAGALVAYTTSATDAEDGPLTPTCAPLSGSTFPLGTTTVTCTAIDAGGLTGTAAFSVIVSDTTAPVLALPSDLTAEAGGPAGVGVSFTASASDLVSGALPVACQPVSGAIFPLGDTLVTCSATDAAGNTGSGSFTITVVDTTAPDVSVPADISQEATGPDGAPVAFTASAQDLVDGSVETTCDYDSGDTFALGDSLVTCSATDAAGNTGSGSFTITVVDTTAPDVSVPADISQEATGPDGAPVAFTASAQDLVDGSVETTCDYDSGDTFALGDSLVTCSATDAAGNTGSGSFTITVVDTTAPDVSVPADISQEATGPDGAPVAFTASAQDLVDGSVETTCDYDSGDTFALGDSLVTCSATDAAGNTGSGSFTITVVDTTAPDLLLLDVTAEATGSAGAIVTFTAAATDLVDGLLPAGCDHASGDGFPLGDTIVTCTATDTHSNTGTGSFRITVQDTTAPVLMVPLDIVAEATGPGGAVVVYSAGADDLVDGPVAPACSPASGETFAIGTTPVGCSATDAHGNTSSGSFHIAVLDTTPPTLTLPADLTVEATGPSGAAVTFGVSASDVVDGPVTPDCDATSGTTFPLGLATVTCSATDAHGNVSSGSFNVTVQDTTPPTLTLPADLTVEATGPSGAAVTFGVSADDVVDGPVTPDCDATSGTTFPLGLTTVMCSATDAHDNSSSASFDVAVQDATAPTLTLPADIHLLATSSSGAWVTYAASASDLVDGDLPISCSPTSGSPFPVGTSTVGCSAIDAHGNQATGNFKVSVLYDFNGFFQPVDNPVGGSVVWNKAKAGSAIPVKFSLGGDRGMNVLADGALLASMLGAPPVGPSASPWVEKVTCGSTTTEDTIESTVTANASGLIYDTGAKQYHYVWKTSTSWANSCRVLHVTLKDGTDHVAYVHFTK